MTSIVKNKRFWRGKFQKKIFVLFVKKYSGGKGKIIYMLTKKRKRARSSRVALILVLLCKKFYDWKKIHCICRFKKGKTKKKFANTLGENEYFLATSNPYDHYCIPRGSTGIFLRVWHHVKLYLKLHKIIYFKYVCLWS